MNMKSNKALVWGIAKAALKATIRYPAHSLGDNGIRVNTISAEAIRTPSSAAIGGVAHIQRSIKIPAPLARNIEQEDIAKTALYLLSYLALSLNGDVLCVDASSCIMAY